MLAVSDGVVRLTIVLETRCESRRWVFPLCAKPESGSYRLAEWSPLHVFSKVFEEGCCRADTKHISFEFAPVAMDAALEQRLEKIRSSPKLQSQQEVS